MRSWIFRQVWAAALVFLFLFPDAAAADSTRSRRWYLPHYVPIQFAGNIGFLSMGVGYGSRNSNYQFELLYGYVPYAVAKTTIHSITAKNHFPLGNFLVRDNRTVIPYLGLGLSVEVSGNSFFLMPSHFPESYYDFPKNLHVIAYGGMRLRHLFQDNVTWLRGVELYAEAGTLDVYVWYKTISSEIRMHEIFSLAVGLNLLLDHE